MSPGEAIVLAANAALQDSKVRDSIRQMHQEGESLADMVVALGLEEEMTPEIRQILDGLPADVVTEIRQVTLDMLNGADYQMPIDCEVFDQNLALGVNVDVGPDSEGQPAIRVRPESSQVTA